MNTNAHESDFTEIVIGCAFEVANVLGAGFLEKVYERALLRELTLRGLTAKAQVSFPVRYKDHYVGDYVADLVVEERLIVELKCADRLGNEHLAQCINYLKASALKVALLINFQRPKLEWKRVILDESGAPRSPLPVFITDIRPVKAEAEKPPEPQSPPAKTAPRSAASNAASR